MSTPTAVEERLIESRPAAGRRLFVAWQHPETRQVSPVGALEEPGPDGSTFLFRYLAGAAEVAGFHPFVGFPDFDDVFRSEDLFPFFANRLMPRSRSDFARWVQALGLAIDADPFEILSRSAGRRATDTVEVFPEPAVVDGVAVTTFLARGIRHLPNADGAIETLIQDDHLLVMHDAQNPEDHLALALRTDGQQMVGYVPRYLAPLVHRSREATDWSAVKVTVAHIGEQNGPAHLRLLCCLQMPWPFEISPGEQLEKGRPGDLSA